MTGADAASEMLAERYGAVLARIERAGGRGVAVVAVTKSFGAWAIDAAARCGIGHIGESYAQECVAKLAEATAEPMPQVHFVGRLQRNKVRVLAGRVDMWQTVDRPELASEIGRRAPGSQVMIQVNISGEASKGGCAPGEAETLAGAVSDAGLRLVGLMGIAPLCPPEGRRESFRSLRRMTDSLGLPHCSMGMTDDLEVAVAEGATLVRVGRSLFGKRPRHGIARVPQWGLPAEDDDGVEARATFPRKERRSTC